MQSLHQTVEVRFQYDVHFTEGLFRSDNPLLARTVRERNTGEAKKVLAVVDAGVVAHHPALPEAIAAYAAAHGDGMTLAGPLLVVPGGEAAKNDPALVERIHEAVYQTGLCRHSYVLAVGGGAVLDMAGYAAATAHRGIRLIRVPTTVLAQNDSGIGVKNSVNACGTKNFLGTFAPPVAVLNDVAFLDTLEDRDWRAGIAEAVKVALIKEADFFDYIEAEAERLAPPARDRAAMQEVIFRCARLHLDHIATSGDPFELGSSRPLDFGHWAAHQLEQLSGYALRHGEAVALGIALDCTYAYLAGLLDEAAWERVLRLFEALGFVLYVPEMSEALYDGDHPRSLFRGLEAFREHLGGQLTIMLLEAIGRGVEVHAVDRARYRAAVDLLQRRWAAVEDAA